MNADEIVRRYVDAWNRQDVAGLLKLMHNGAAYYDAFWMETCVGRDLAQYFQDTIDQEPYWFEQIGETIITENGVTYRYSAHDRGASTIGEPILYGAGILGIKDNKILNVTDIYCSPVRSDLKAVAEVAAQRHGLTRHINDGLGAQQAARIKAGLYDSIEQDRVYLDPDITMSQIAEIVGCTLDQLSIVLESHFGASFAEFVDAQRINYAKELLASSPDEPDVLHKIAISSGFRSESEFRKRFAEFVGITPRVFYSKQKDLAQNDLHLH